MARGPLPAKHPPGTAPHPAPARRARGVGKGVLGRYLVLSPKGSIADAGRRGAAAGPRPTRTPAGAGATPPVRRVSGAGSLAPGRPLAPRRAAPWRGAPRTAAAARRRGEPHAQPGPAPPPSPRPRGQRRLRPFPKGRPGASPSARRSPVGAPAPHRVRGLRGPARDALSAPLPAPPLQPLLLPSPASVSHARPSARGAAPPGGQLRPRPPRPSALAPVPAELALGSLRPRGTRPPRVHSTPRRSKRKEVRGTAGTERDAAPALTRGRLPRAAAPGLPRRRAPSPAPRPAGPRRGDGGGARPPGPGWGWCFRSCRDGAQTVLVSPRRLRAPGGGQGAREPLPGMRAAGAGPRDIFVFELCEQVGPNPTLGRFGCARLKVEVSSPQQDRDLL